MDSVQWIWQCLAVIEEKRTPKRGSIIWQGKRDLKVRFIKEALYSYVKVPGFYCQGKKGFIRRISTRKMIWLILHVREKTGRDRLVVCQIWWSCSLFLSVFLWMKWTAYSGLIVRKYETFIALSHKFRNSYARVASTTFIK